MDVRYLREDVYDDKRRVTPAGSKLVVVSQDKDHIHCLAPLTGMKIDVGRSYWDSLPRRAPKWAKFTVTEIKSLNGLEPIVRLEEFAAGEPLTAKDIGRMFKGKFGTAAKFLLALLKDKPVGFLAYTPDPKWSTIDRLVVRENERRKGCATALVQALRCREDNRKRGWIRSWVPGGTDFLPLHKTLAANGFAATIDDEMIRFGRREALVDRPEPIKELS